MHSSIAALLSKPKPVKDTVLPVSIWVKRMPDGKGGWGGPDMPRIVSEGTDGAVEYEQVGVHHEN